MRPHSFFRFSAYTIMCLALVACSSSDQSGRSAKIVIADTLHPVKDLVVSTTDLPENPAGTPQEKDTVSIWTYDYKREMPVKNKAVKPELLNPKKMIQFLNNDEKIVLELVKISRDTIYVKIKESTYLTQEMGTTGANEFMSITTYTLTELKGIRYVNYDFEEGDHAVPGTYSRKYYEDRAKRNEALNKK